MDALTLPYFQKIDRAERHLGELRTLIEKWSESVPYGVEADTSGERTIYRLAFRSRPENSEIPIVVADVIYNLRSALDQMACALVAPQFRREVYFPIFWKGVWAPKVAGEDQRFTSDRGKWKRWTENMPPKAIPILKEAQPAIPLWRATESMSGLSLIHGLAMQDRHRRLPITPMGLQGVTVLWKDVDGSEKTGSDPRSFHERALVKEGADLAGDIPDGASVISVVGTPVAAVFEEESQSDVALLATLDQSIGPIRTLLAALSNHVHPAA